MIDKELNIFFPWYDCWGCPAELEWRLMTISAVALNSERQAYIQHKEDSKSPNFTADHTTTYIKTPDKTDSARQHLL